MTEVNATGFLRTRLDERITALKASMTAIFGSDINMDPDTIDGQLIGIFSEAVSDLDQLAEAVYHSFNPQSASGAALSRLVQLNGITRQDGIKSTVTVRCTGTQGTVIPAGSRVKSPSTGVVFETNANATIAGVGYIDVAATATEFGALTAPIGAVNQIDSPVFGWQSVTNLAAAAIGRAEETDAALRIRRSQSTVTSATAIIEALTGTLANLPGVTTVKVFENDTGAVDGNGIPGHAIYCVVTGGVDADIRTAIFNKKSLGVYTHGAVVGTVTDSQGIGHTIRFSRPTNVPIYLAITLTALSGWPTDGVQQIKDKIVAWSLANIKVGDDVIRSRIFDPINEVPGHTVSILNLGTAPAPAGTADIIIAFDAIATFNAVNISVTVL